jgi:hypothetical protein
MPQTTGPVAPTVLHVLKTIYEQGVQYDINLACPAFAAISREGTKKPVRAKFHKFALKTNIGQTARTYNGDAPCAGFAVCDQPPEYCDVDLTYKKIYIPYRVCHEVMEEATNEGAMLDVLANDLDDLVEQHVHHLERSLFTGDGRDVLFSLVGGSQTNPAPGVFCYNVKWYGGISGEELGDILESLLLINMSTHAAEACGQAPRTTTKADNSSKIISVDPTLGNESVCFDVAFAAYADGDIIYRSRQDTAGVQGCNDGITGLPLLSDDFSLADPFQGVDSADCPSFAGRCCDNGGDKRDLDEALLETAIATAMVRRGRRREDTFRFQKYAFFAHEKTARRFALQLTADRRFTAPALFSTKAMKPKAGIDMDFLTYDGIPWVTSQLALRNTVFLVDLENVVCIHNGAPEGQFLQAPNGPIVERIGCTPTFEYIWWAFIDFAVRKRNGMVCIKDLNSMEDCNSPVVEQPD